jgi:hypothetical protein
MDSQFLSRIEWNTQASFHNGTGHAYNQLDSFQEKELFTSVSSWQQGIILSKKDPVRAAQERPKINTRDLQ